MDGVRELDAAEAMPADALDEAQVNALVADIARRHGRIDILVNAVGGSTIIADPAATTEKLTLAEWQALLHFNLTGTFLFTHAVLPVMQAQKSGAIINISTAWAFEPSAMFPTSAVFRAGLAAFTKVFADSYAADNLRMNNILPGWIDSLPATEERRRSVPMQRYGTVREIAATIAFLASDGAGYITGQNIRVDGGLTRAV